MRRLPRWMTRATATAVVGFAALGFAPPLAAAPGAADQSITVVIPEISDVAASFDAPPSIAPGVASSADLIVTVSGNTPATDLSVRVSMPPSLTASAPGATTDASGALVWSVASIAPQTPIRLSITLMPAATLVVGAPLELHAAVVRPNGAAVDTSIAVQAVSAASMRATPSSSPAATMSPWVVLAIATTLVGAMIVGPARRTRRSPEESHVSP